MTESLTAFELLLDIDRRCRLLAADLPSQETRLQGWSGIGFRVGEQWFVAPMREVAEVLHEPRCTLMPGVKTWIRGVANLRGRLLPVMDLGGFLGHALSKADKQRRVLVVEYQDIFSRAAGGRGGGYAAFRTRRLVAQRHPRRALYQWPVRR